MGPRGDSDADTMTLDPSTLKERLALAMARPRRAVLSIDDWNREMCKQFICDLRGFHSCMLFIDEQETICMKQGFCECVCGAQCDTLTNKWTEYEPR
jgi:hypothetical protein